MNVYIIRHTSVDVPPGICYGQTDVSLTDTFEQEATNVKQQLDHIPMDAVISSPLTRCKRLANFCKGHQPIEYDDRIKEMNFGSWEMKKWDELNTAEWENNWIGHVVPGGESFKLVFDRVKDFLDELKTNEYQNVAVFTHGGVSACAHVYFGATQPEDAWDLRIDYGQIAQFEL